MPKARTVIRSRADIRTTFSTAGAADVRQAFHSAAQPAAPTLTVLLSDGSARQCPSTEQGFAALLADLCAAHDEGDAA